MKTSGKSILPVFIIILVLAGAASCWLYFTGKLDEFIEKPEQKPAPVVEEVTKPLPESVKVTPVKTPVVEKVAEQPPAEDAVAARYRAKFKTPKIGSKVSVALKSRKKMAGVLTHLDDTSLKLKTTNVELTLMRSQLAPSGLARLYEDDYVKYMVAQHKRREARARELKKTDEKLLAAYQKYLAKQGKAKGGSSKLSADQVAGDVDFKKYMEKVGATDLIKERQERIQAYEKERMKAGREY